MRKKTHRKKKMNSFSVFTHPVVADLAFGNEIQRRVLEKIGGSSVRCMDGYFPFFDVALVLDGRIQFLEFKSDRIGYASGNLAIEFLHNGKDSGIRTSKADRWIYTLVAPDASLEIFDIPAAVLKEKIGLLEYETIKSTQENLTAFYIFPKEVFNAFRIE